MKLIVGNQKNYMTLSEVSEYLKKIDIEDKKVIICPSNIYLPYFLNKGFSVGIQNVIVDNDKAYTGEINTKQAKSMNIKYTIIGHSERRQNFDETDKIINEKIKDALKNNLKVILCIGETLEQRQMYRTTRVLKKQLLESLKDINDFKNIIIAYEPVWAIGTNVIPENSDIIKTALYIKEIIKQNSENKVPILYGGSVNKKNIKELNKIEEIDGFLIGKASTSINEFKDIVEVVRN